MSVNRRRLAFFSSMVGMTAMMSFLPGLGIVGEFVATGALLAVLGAKWLLCGVPFAALFNSESLYPAYRAILLIVDTFFHMLRIAERVPAAYHGLAYLFAIDYYTAVVPVLALLCIAVYVRLHVLRRLGGRTI